MKITKRCFLATVLFISFYTFSQSEAELDSLKKVSANSLSPDTVRFKALSDLVWYYVNTKPAKALPFIRQEVNLGQKIGKPKFISDSWNDLAIYFQAVASYDSALFYNSKALAIREKSGDKAAVFSSLSKEGLILQELGRYTGALAAQQKALTLCEALGNKYYVGKTYNNIATIFMRLRNPDKQIEYNEKALSIFSEMGARSDLAKTYGNLGSAYNLKKNIKKSNEYFNNALDIFAESGDSIHLAMTLNSIGVNYRLEEKTREALPFYERAVEISSKLGDLSGEILYAHNLSSVYKDLKDYKRAEAMELLVLARTSTGHEFQRMLSYRTLSSIYAFMNQAIKSERYLDSFVILKDKVFSKENASAVSEMETKFNTERKEKENLKLQRDIAEQKEKISRRNLWIISVTLLFALFAVISVFYFVRYRLQQKLKFEAETLKQQEARNKAIVEAEQKERIRIARDLHDGVGQLLSAAKLHLSDLQYKLKGSATEDNLNNAIGLVDDSVKEVRMVSHNMMPNALMQHGLAVGIRDFISKISGNETLKIDLEINGLEARTDQTIETVLYRVMQELVNNVIRHSEANHLSIQVIKHEKEITVVMEDNGKGFDTSIINQEKGIGLKNIISRIKFLNGTVDFDSTPGKGTTVVIEVPA